MKRIDLLGKHDWQSFRGLPVIKPAFFLLATLLELTACAVGPDYVLPSITTPKQWRSAAVVDDGRILHLQQWWRNFHDPILEHLINQAISSNLDLKLAESRIRASRLQYDATYAAAWPALSSHSTASRRLNNTNAASGSTTGGGFGVGNQLINIFQLGFDATWEIDLFGGVQRSMEAQQANIEFEQESRNDRLVSLLAEVARNYIQLRTNQQLQQVCVQNLTNQEQLLKLVQVRYRAGLVSSVDIAQSEGQLAAIQAQLPLYASAEKQALHAIALLLGQTPTEIAAQLNSVAPIPVSTQIGLADLPSELLRRRPDIRMAERKLAASSAEIGIAVTELYPKINLSAFLGLQNLRVTDFNPLGKSWSTAATLTLPIFNWGRLKTNIKVKEALNEQAFISYQSSILTAIKEVEDALTGYWQEWERSKALIKQVKAQQLLITLATERYQKGLATYLEVLDAQRGIYAAEQEQLDSQAKQGLQLVALCKALGGGWQK